MDKEQIKRIIVSNQQYVQKVKLMQRDFYFEEMGNYVFIGIRRAGKSFLMFQRIQEMLSTGISSEQILYINFEDDRLINLTIEDLDLIFRSYGELYAHKPIFFFDEIQIVPGWEKFVRRLADNNYRVYVTGSNAKMLSNEIMTTL
jgi:predicted AAA+ superfamily ATPase